VERDRVLSISILLVFATLYRLVGTSDQKRNIEKRLIREENGANVEPRKACLLDEECCVGA